MEEMKLKVQKRAFPSHGRSRVHSSVLESLGVGARETLTVGVSEKKLWITVAAYGDSMVQQDCIRLSEEDLATLGVSDGDVVTVKKTPPLMDQMKQTATQVTEQVAGKLEGIRGKISATVSPVTQKAEDAAKEAYARVSRDLPSRDDVSRALEAAKKKIAPNLVPDEAGMLLRLIYENKGAIRSAVIPPSAREQTVGGLPLPAGTIVVAVMRAKEGLIIPSADTNLLPEDRVFFIGKEENLPAALKLLEG